jgi:hypothetical protein
MRTCGKCNIEKPLNEYNKHPQGQFGRDATCKKCKAAYAREYRKKNPDKIKAGNLKFKKKYLEETNGYAVYYLPEEHYVGFTNNLRSRMNDHKKRGKSVYGYEVICVCKSPIDAHLYETMLHQRGYNGFQHSYQ